MDRKCMYCEKHEQEDKGLFLCGECSTLAHKYTSKEVCNIIQNYVIDNGIESLTIELNKYWENGFLMNLQVKLNEEGKRYIYE